MDICNLQTLSSLTPTSDLFDNFVVEQIAEFRYHIGR